MYEAHERTIRVLNNSINKIQDSVKSLDRQNRYYQNELEEKNIELIKLDSSLKYTDEHYTNVISILKKNPEKVKDYIKTETDGDSMKLAIKLVERTRYKLENDLIIAQNDILKEQISIQDNIISNQDFMLKMKDQIISNKDYIIQSHEENYKLLERKLKRQKLVTKLIAIGSAIGVGIIIGL